MLFMVLTEHQYVIPRLIPALETWLATEQFVLLFEATKNETVMAETMRLIGPHLSRQPQSVRAVEFMRKEAPKARIVGAKQRGVLPVTDSSITIGPTEKRPTEGIGGAWKNLPALTLVFPKYSRFSWYVFVDDDSYIIQHNLRVLLSSFYGPRHAVPHRSPSASYMGQVSTWRVGETLTVFAQGGAGIFLSNALMRAIQEHVTECRWNCGYLTHGDVRLGCCIGQSLLAVAADGGVLMDT